MGRVINFLGALTLAGLAYSFGYHQGAKQIDDLPYKVEKTESSYVLLDKEHSLRYDIGTMKQIYTNFYKSLDSMNSIADSDPMREQQKINSIESKLR